MNPYLKVSYFQSPERSDVYGYALHVKVTESAVIPREIFVYQRGVKGTNTGEYVDHFINIGSPVDIENTGTEPDLDHGVPYYRTCEVTLYFRCLDDLYEAKNDIDNDIAHLVETYKLLENEEDYSLEEKEYA